MNLRDVIGNVNKFYQDLLVQLEEKKVAVDTYPLSHLCFRVATIQEYERTQMQVKNFASAYSQHIFHDRPFSVFVLKQPYIFSPIHTVQLLELPSPKPGHSYPTGLEHIGFVVDKTFSEFQQTYATVLGKENDRITFPNGHSAKFYAQSLLDTMKQEGHVFHQL